MIEIKGMAWNHPRGYQPLIAASKEFKKVHPKISIKWDVRTLKEFGDMPIESLIERYDLITIDHPYMGQADKKGLLLKLEGHIPNSRLNILQNQSLGPCFDSYKYNGHVYALPIDAAAQVAAYRSDILSEFGLSFPKKYKELKNFYKKVPKDFSVAWALCPTDLWCTFLTLCAQNRGSNFIENRIFDEEVGSMVLDEIKYHLDFLHPGSINWNPIQILDKMGNGEEILYCPYLFGYTNYSREGHSRNLVRFINSPVGLQKDVSTLLGGVGLAASSLTKYPDVTAKFIDFVAGDKIQNTIYTLNEGQPANVLAWQNEDNNALCNNFFNDTITTVERAYVRPRHPGWNDFQEQGANVLHEGVLKNRSSNKIVNDVNELYKSIE